MTLKRGRGRWKTVLDGKKYSCRRLVRARINDCHRRLNYYKDKLQQRLDKLRQFIPTDLLDTILTIADRRANKTAEQHRTKTQLKLTQLQRTKDKKTTKTRRQLGQEYF